MAEYDETLEIGIAAGLDVPTAMVVAQRDEKPPRQPSGCLGGLLLVVFPLVGMVFIFCH